MTTMLGETLSSVASVETLAALREIARRDGRDLEAVVDEASQNRGQTTFLTLPTCLFVENVVCPHFSHFSGLRGAKALNGSSRLPRLTRRP
ncbi:hypothetical protein [Thiohalocapsa sp. ML1]|uniref:hypothetical protein n=1 Tax=Thiohalocapsa sp. ML1 TaxID=1431688 RepID=UPI0012E336DB|nr:hypothetical protein [Thiohalocapsa sp. ML1]